MVHIYTLLILISIVCLHKGTGELRSLVYAIPSNISGNNPCLTNLLYLMVEYRLKDCIISDTVTVGADSISAR